MTWKKIIEEIDKEIEKRNRMSFKSKKAGSSTLSESHSHYADGLEKAKGIILDILSEE